MDCEKWFSTGGDIADFFIVHVLAIDEDGSEPRPDALPRRHRARASRSSTTRRSPTTSPSAHPTVRFAGVELADAQRLGAIGAGDALTNEWFIEERVHIAARCVGAMERLLEIGTAWALEREQFGQRIMDFQGVSFPLADAACAALSMKLLTRHVAQLADAGADPKLVHGKASMAKLAASEAAGRVADAVVQVLGGRGYMRTNAAERLWREVRVDRIWEGTSEIQRLVVARGLEKRGVDAMLSHASSALRERHVTTAGAARAAPRGFSERRCARVLATRRRSRARACGTARSGREADHVGRLRALRGDAELRAGVALRAALRGRAVADLHRRAVLGREDRAEALDLASRARRSGSSGSGRR